MAVPGSGAGCPLLPQSSLLGRFIDLACGGLSCACLVVRLLEVLLKVLVKTFLHKLGVAALQPVRLHLPVEELLALSRIFRNFTAAFAFTTVPLALAEAAEAPLSSFVAFVLFVFLLLT